MDLLNAARAPRKGQNRRTHSPAPNQVDRARCGAKVANIVMNDADPAKTTCLSCRADLHRDGILPDKRRKS